MMSARAYEQELRQIFGTSHRRTKILRDPGMINHAELLELSDLLHVPPLFLVDEFGAADNLTEREKENLRAVQEAATI